MDESPRCERCGVALTGQSVGELCANCLLKLALDPPHSETSPLTDPARVRYFGDYELIEEIARGGMGVVYRARQVSLNRSVALKMILGGDFSSLAMVQRFQTEAEAAARLEHPNIVPIYEIGTHEGQHYFSMRFLEGGSLAQRLVPGSRPQEACETIRTPNSDSRNGSITPREAAELIVKVARAVHHAHQRGILHRDLKPGNILFDQAGQPHVADFGLAKLLESDTHLTQTLALMGTPSYMAPEQAGGQTKQMSTAADIYGLGAILYELLTGRPPFQGSTAVDVMRQVVHAEPMRPRQFNPSLDRDLETVCMKCLEKDPARRYGSADALGEDLQRWLHHEPIQARRARLFDRVWKWSRRTPAVASLVVALHFVGLVGFIGIVREGKRARTQAALATLEARRAQVEAGKALRESTRAESELWNANLNEARALRIAGGSGARTQSSALLRKLIQRPGLSESQILDLREEAIAQLTLVDIVMPTNWISKTSWKPMTWNSNLDQYVHDTGSNHVEVREFPTERVVASFSGPTEAVVYQAVFSPDNQYLAVRFSQAGGEVRVWRLDATEPLLRTVCDRFLDSNILWISPDSRTLAMLTPRGVAVQPIAANSTPRWLQAGRPATAMAFSSNAKQIAVMFRDSPGAVEIWDAESGETQRSFKAGFHPNFMAWHPDGSRLVLGGDRGKLEVQTLTMGGEVDESASRSLPLVGHTAQLYRGLFVPGGATLVTHSADNLNIVWDLISCRPLLREQRVILSQINVLGDRAVVLQESPMLESVAHLIQRSGYRTAAWAGEPRLSNGVWISPDGRLGVVSYNSTVANTEGDCLLWDYARGAEIARLKGGWAQFSADSRTLFTFERFEENCVRRYDVSVETLANRPVSWNQGVVLYQGQAGERVNSGTMAPDGRTLVVAASDTTIFLDTFGRHPIRSLAKPAHIVDLSNDGKWMVTARHNDPIVLRMARLGEAVVRFEPLSLARFSQDSLWLAVVNHRSVRLYSLQEITALQERHELHSLEPAYPPIALEAGNGVAPPVVFSPSNRIFAVPYNRTHVRLYETATGRTLATLSPPNLAQIIGAKSLNFSADGQWLLAAKNDGETIAWNIPVIRSELSKLGLDWEVSAERIEDIPSLTE